MTSICIASSYRAAFREIGDYAAMGLRHYARKHGHAFFEDDASVDLAFSSSLRSVSRSMKSWAAIELVFLAVARFASDHKGSKRCLRKRMLMERRAQEYDGFGAARAS